MNQSLETLPSLAPAVPGVVIRPLEPGDADAMAEILAQPGVRWGTLSLPYRSRVKAREWIESWPDNMTAVVAELEGRLAGSASLTQLKRRRGHVGQIGISVHDAYRRRGVGSALMAALIDVADNWLNLKRVELTVYADNVAAIALYEKFGFVTEGVGRAFAFRDGGYADALFMARIKERP